MVYKRLYVSEQKLYNILRSIDIERSPQWLSNVAAKHYPSRIKIIQRCSLHEELDNEFLVDNKHVCFGTNELTVRLLEKIRIYHGYNSMVDHTELRKSLQCHVVYNVQTKK